MHRDHRPLAWLGGLLLAAATWVRLYDVGVQAPEAYTLPTAVALVLVGLYRLQRDFDADTTTTLLPGLALATVPSLLWALVDPVSPRAALLGAGCLVLLLGGAALRWSAPVLVGGLVGAALVLRELAPYAAADAAVGADRRRRHRADRRRASPGRRGCATCARRPAIWAGCADTLR